MVAALIKVLKAHHAPHEIALGIAIGSFIAVLPLYGLHTILCVVAIVLVPKVNKISVFFYFVTLAVVNHYRKKPSSEVAN